ncbi:helix-turn-helix transcriptional regulator [Paenibacillus sp. J22TS3]|uniref:helix-turn-helix domain-containing protein n=1 Tax=Paenibacillus sp. J22TS3 TaxID=2807192 RepID=UPI001B235FE7|nr:helix-turn-helix transcriptional regulator [Paenibacillus sp. J22TS3]GIP20165.1 hypothetical protein J22TS3_04400 [Paenibacillus sp. J22TS3]
MIKFNLEHTIQQIGITKNKLAVLSEVRPNTINDLANGTSKRIEIDTLEKILTTINQISVMRGLNKRFNVSDVVEFVSLDFRSEDAESGKLISDEAFLKIKEILSKHHVPTPIAGLEITNILQLIDLYEDHIKEGVYEVLASKSSSALRTLNRILYGIGDTLELYGLVEYKQDSYGTFYTFTDKGNFFMKLLKNQ